MNKLKITKSIAVITTAAVLLSSCATIVSKTNYPVHFRISPPNAEITITNKKGKEVYRGRVLESISLKSGHGYFSKARYTVKISAPGYKEKTVTVNYKLNGWYFGNLLVGGALGLIIIDPLTGAMWKIDDSVVDEKLEEVGTTSNNVTLKIIDIKDISTEQKSKLVRLN